MGLRWGFKTEANETAREVRRELGLCPAARLDPWRLADHLDIPVLALGHLAASAPRALRQFQEADPGEFSAITVFSGRRRLVVYNDVHSRGRQSSDLGHELSHALLLHEPSPALDHLGCRLWQEDLEEEADWLAGALLVSDEAALSVAANGVPTDLAAENYGVSEPMMRFRLNVTGAYARVARRRGRSARRPVLGRAGE